MDLKDKKCVPCSTYTPPLAAAEKIRLLNTLDSQWQLNTAQNRLLRHYKFKNFKKALEFANAVGKIAEEEKHHPEMHLGWGHCHIEIWTHMNNDLLENDFILAAKIEAEFRRLFPS
jgi:4a-hydroxytetrahydrobiopterin dehydratase